MTRQCPSMDFAPDRDAVFQPRVSSASTGAAPSPVAIDLPSPTLQWLKCKQLQILVATDIYGCGASFYLPTFLFPPLIPLHPQLGSSPHIYQHCYPLYRGFCRCPGLSQCLHSSTCTDLGTTLSSICGWFCSAKPLVLLLCYSVWWECRAESCFGIS